MKEDEQQQQQQWSVSAREPLADVRQFFRRRAWGEALQAFVIADEKTALEAVDLEQFATVAYLAGRDEEYITSLERAYNAHLECNQFARATRCAFWLGFHLHQR